MSSSSTEEASALRTRDECRAMVAVEDRVYGFLADLNVYARARGLALSDLREVLLCWLVDSYHDSIDGSTIRENLTGTLDLFLAERFSDLAN